MAQLRLADGGAYSRKTKFNKGTRTHYCNRPLFYFPAQCSTIRRDVKVVRMHPLFGATVESG